MKLKKLMCASLVSFAILQSANVSAEIATVAYHCPTIEQAGDIGIRTTINHKDVNWYIEKGSNLRGDEPVDFIGALLEKKKMMILLTCLLNVSTKPKQIKNMY